MQRSLQTSTTIVSRVNPRGSRRPVHLSSETVPSMPPEHTQLLFLIMASLAACKTAVHPISIYVSLIVLLRSLLDRITLAGSQAEPETTPCCYLGLPFQLAQTQAQVPALATTQVPVQAQVLAIAAAFRLL
jgi:hypothetical protein